ncbi:MAG: D-alanine--D-alanine ligase [Flavobacteriaceae bacterium]|nr:D-alanine--D-alanine ligase [Flavobacteriaceae bacterium]
MIKKHVAVVMGGYSSEFEISIQSGSVVCELLDPQKYFIYPIHLLKDGWNHVTNDGGKFPVNKADFSFSNGNETIKPDVIFNTIHGTPGEDGYLQAYLSLIEIPQTSADFYQAALSFNKRDCLSVLKGFGVKCATSFYINQGENYSKEEIINTVGMPCFVKPNRAGSSFGISKVYKKEELDKAIHKAFEEDAEIIIETAIEGVEVSVGVFNKNDEIVVLPITEIVSENDYFDYEAKYLGKSDEITPARIPESEAEMVRKEIKRIYQLLNMTGVTRSEFIIQDGIPYFLEINTNPGISKESIIPKQVRASGLTLTEFFDILIQNVLK